MELPGGKFRMGSPPEEAERGEWYGYLHRDGRISVRLKGNSWKGPFHLPRMQLEYWKM